jgi:prevent-host-death family protein
MNIRVVTSTEAQNQFGKLIEDAKKEPVMIQKNGRDQVVVLSVDEFNKITNERDVNPLVKNSLERSLKRWDKLYESLAK